MNTLAIIPAREGSKRIPKKNIRLFCGKPIIAWSIEAAKKTGIFDRIIVSTDAEDIVHVAKEWNAEVPFIRPKEFADDFTGTNAVLKHCLQWLLKRDASIEYACCIYATAPFLHPRYLRKGLEALKKGNCSFVFSATSYSFPIQRSIRIRPDGYIEPLFPQDIPKRSQDIEEAYHDAGQFYWGRPESFLQDKPMFYPPSRAIILPRYLVLDIDDLEDWKRAELMFKAWQLDQGKE